MSRTRASARKLAAAINKQRSGQSRTHIRATYLGQGSTVGLADIQILDTVMEDIPIATGLHPPIGSEVYCRQDDAMPLTVVSVLSNPGVFHTSTVSYFETVAERDAAFPTPFFGQLCSVAETGERYRYSSSWVSDVPRLVLSAGQTVTDNVTLQNLTNMLFALEINCNYFIEGALPVNSVGTEANDVQFGLTVPSGATGRWCVQGAPATTGNQLDSINHGWAALNVAQNLGVRTSIAYMNHVACRVVMSSTPGNIQFQMCEATATGGTTSVVLGSTAYLRCWKLT